jgi:hypothetical protein
MPAMLKSLVGMLVKLLWGFAHCLPPCFFWDVAVHVISCVCSLAGCCGYRKLGLSISELRNCRHGFLQLGSIAHLYGMRSISLLHALLVLGLSARLCSALGWPCPVLSGL